MQMEKLTIKAQEALKEAQEIARRNSNQEVDAEHLVAALLAQSDSLVPSLVQKLGASPAALSDGGPGGNRPQGKSPGRFLLRFILWLRS